MVIFGASGDLAHRKLLPALYSLTRDRLLPARFAIVGFARRAISDEVFREEMRAACDEHRAPPPDRRRAVVGVRAQHLLPAGRLRRPRLVHRAQGAPRGHRADAGPARQPRLLSRDAAVVVRGGDPRPRPGELAPPPPPPEARAPSPPPPFARVIIEKPFGTDLETARALNRDIHATLDERQIYRIDHYLGKETVQNLLVFRFANGIFEPVWNNHFVDHVQITGAESIGVEGARRLLRAGGQPARHGAEPPACRS